MSRHTSRNVGLAAMVAMMLASGVALANPEVGGNFAQKLALLNITSTNATVPTILTTVVVRCPAAGFLIANADASFQLGFPIDSVDGLLFFGISRNSTAADLNDGHSIESEN